MEEMIEFDRFNVDPYQIWVCGEPTKVSFVQIDDEKRLATFALEDDSRVSVFLGVPVGRQARLVLGDYAMPGSNYYNPKRELERFEVYLDDAPQVCINYVSADVTKGDGSVTSQVVGLEKDMCGATTSLNGWSFITAGSNSKRSVGMYYNRLHDEIRDREEQVLDRYRRMCKSLIKRTALAGAPTPPTQRRRNFSALL